MKLITNTVISNLKKVVHPTYIALITSLIFSFGGVSVNAQAVTKIITDYQGYWQSSTSNNNTVKPVTSHNVLAFEFGGQQYSTGVNDGLLAANAENFIPGDFWSLPFSGFTGTVTSNTKVGVGEMYDTLHNGRGIAPDAPLESYLNDGIKGLDLGTCVANLPAGNLYFSVANINPANIGDGIPDILVTQVADPGGSTDKYSFIDANGNIIGVKKNILFTNISPVGQWTADFYEAVGNPRALSSGFTNTSRDIRLWAADLSEFGITSANYSQIKKFAVDLSGNSDVAFVAYNNKSFTITHTLPVTVTDFNAIAADASCLLTWKTVSEHNSKNFVVERSTNNQSYQAIATINAAGNSSSIIKYYFTDLSPYKGNNFYRLKMVDMDGSATYSDVVLVKITRADPPISVYPNPATSIVSVQHGLSRGTEVISLSTAMGTVVLRKNCVRNTVETKLSIEHLSQGIYYLTFTKDRKHESQALIIR